jgi:integrase
LTGKLRIQAKAVTVEHHESMPFARVPAFYAALGALGTVDAHALQWTILTGARTDEVIGGEAKAPATWGEITDVDGNPTWIIPKTRMKGKQTHRVPLSAAAVALLGKRRADNVPLFKASSARALLDTLKANGGNGFTVHGFRASFQDWILATTAYGADLADMCIAHDTRGKVRKAYQRSDRLAERRPILLAWSEFLTTSAK